jgi:hypothetical protein
MKRESEPSAHARTAQAKRTLKLWLNFMRSAMRFSRSFLTSAWRFCVSRCFSSLTKSRNAGSASAGGWRGARSISTHTLSKREAERARTLGAGLGVPLGTLLPSGALTATFGTSFSFSFSALSLPSSFPPAAAAATADGAVEPFVDPALRAPGGTYAFWPLTTAPYLSSSPSPAAAPAAPVRFITRSSATCALPVVPPRISFASACARRSRSLKSAALRSSRVVYASSSNTGRTPNSRSFAANWSQPPGPAALAPAPNVRSSPPPVDGAPAPPAADACASGAQACSSRSRRGAAL